MIGRMRVLAILGSAALHLCAVVAVLALVTNLRQPEPLFIDLTGGSTPGDERAAHATEPRGSDAKAPPAREARRQSARPFRTPEPAAPVRPTEAAPVPTPSFSASHEAAPADRPAPSPAADSQAASTTASSTAESDTGSGAARGVSSDMPAHTGESQGAVGGGGSRLALAVPGAGRGDVPPEFGPYLARFRQRIQESLVYPLAARRRGLAGRVEIEVVLEPSGRIRDVAVVSSSSHALLDEAAVEAVRSLQPLPLPEQPKRQALRVRLPVVFQLQ
jgi:periplasmic protein TonB